jgi:hypothetical protein
MSPDILVKLIQEGKFEMPHINIQLQNKLSESEILLYLNENQHYRISGFPRCLFEGIKDKTSKYYFNSLSDFQPTFLS